MTWFKIDDSFWRSKKVRKLGEKDRLAAVGLWTLAGDWSADNLTDGFVPWEVVDGWESDRRLAERLIAVGFWIETEKEGETGVIFHDWEDWQPTRDQVIQRRKADADRRARWRAAKRDGTPPPSGPGGHPSDSQRESRQESRRDTRQDTRQESRLVSSLPDPTRPDPTRPVVKEVVTKGGDRSETYARDNATPPTPKRPRCKAHAHLADDEPGPACRACRDVRLAAEAAPGQQADAERARRAEARAVLDACDDCDEAGWLLDADGVPVEPARRCTHGRPLRVVS
ncbi:MAG TPA: hypothetical protein VKA83_22280 [Methylomirabilota bacterium]|nr:hypothetical protein [Methylomirabilota bacterium]